MHDLDGLKILNQFEDDLLRGYDDFRQDSKHRNLLKKLITTSDPDFENNFINRIEIILQREGYIYDEDVKELWSSINGCLEKGNLLMTMLITGGISLISLGIIAIVAQFTEITNLFIGWIGLNLLAVLIVFFHSLSLSFKQKVSLQNIINVEDKKSIEEEVYLIQHYVMREAQRFEDRVISSFLDSRRQKIALLQTNVDLGVEKQIKEIDECLNVIKGRGRDLRLRLISDLINYMDLIEKTSTKLNIASVEAFYMSDVENKLQSFNLRKDTINGNLTLERIPKEGPELIKEV